MEGGPGKMSAASAVLPISMPGAASQPKPMTRRGAMVALSYMACAGEQFVESLCLSPGFI